MTIYPSNTAIKNNMDKGEGEFNNDTYDITASDGQEIEINSVIRTKTSPIYTELLLT